MLRAARGPLSDSAAGIRDRDKRRADRIGFRAGCFVLPVLSSTATARYINRSQPSAASRLYCWAQSAANRVDTLAGMDRNAVTALLTIGPSPASAPAQAHPTIAPSIYNTQPVEDLSRFSGSAMGLNVVMISLESTAAQYLPLYGAKQDVMPNLSALARRALVFDNAYSRCIPKASRDCTRYCAPRSLAFDTQPEQYENLGCQSDRGCARRPGLPHGALPFRPLRLPGHAQSIIQHRGFQTLEDAGDIGGNHQSSFGVDEPATVARMLAWIDALPHGQKFFLDYLPIAGHHPYATPAGGPFSGPNDIDQYRNALHYGDESLGALMRGLRERGLEDNTLWIVYGDHGEGASVSIQTTSHILFSSTKKMSTSRC